LRKYKLDEFPQLVNVLKGEMQLVGARPEVPKYVEMFREQYASLLKEPPGITDPASVAYRDEERFLSSARVEDQYVTDILRSFLSDLLLLLQTAQVVLSKTSPRLNNSQR
jgi:lipopolysaccharide/colanic/teichoic acid biosynthesis glycosyltransferase